MAWRIGNEAARRTTARDCTPGPASTIAASDTEPIPRLAGADKEEVEESGARPRSKEAAAIVVVFRDERQIDPFNTYTKFGTYCYYCSHMLGTDGNSFFFWNVCAW